MQQKRDMPPLIVYSAQFATRPADIYVTNVFADFWQTIAPLYYKNGEQFYYYYYFT